MQNKKEKNMFCIHVLYVVILCNVPDAFLGKIRFNPPANFKNLNYVMPGNQFADIFSIRIAESMLRTKRRIFSYWPSASDKSPTLSPPSPYYHSQPDVRNKKDT